MVRLGFDTLSTGTLVTDQFAVFGLTVEGQATVIATTNTQSPPHALQVQAVPGSEIETGLGLRFDPPVRSVALHLGGAIEPGGAAILTAYNAQGESLGSVGTEAGEAITGFLGLRSSEDIARVTLIYFGSTVPETIDDLYIPVIDTLSPDITAPPNLVRECSGPLGQVVALGQPVVTDLVDPAPIITSNAPALFHLGVTAVTWTATDSSGNQASAVQAVTVVDTTPPVITAPANIIIDCSAHGGQPVSLGTATAADICDPSPAISNDAPALFRLGNTVVTWTATDASGNAASAQQTVTVIDTTPPIITAPPDVTVECSAHGGQAVALGTPTAMDICDPAPVISNDAPALFALGRTVVTWTARDASGNAATAQQVVTVIDTTPPVITAPVDITVECSAHGGQPVALGLPIVTDICDPAPVISNDAPALFALGRTIVTWTARDASGNAATARQAVTVVDTTPPDVQATLERQPGHKTKFKVLFSAADICDPAPRIEALIAIPPVAADTPIFPPEGEVDDDDDDDEEGDKEEIRFILKPGDDRIQLSGPDLTTLRARLTAAMQQGGFLVETGQILGVKLNKPSGSGRLIYRFIFRAGVLTRIEAPDDIHLLVSATDASVNVGVATASSDLKADLDPGLSQQIRDRLATHIDAAFALIDAAEAAFEGLSGRDARQAERLLHILTGDGEDDGRKGLLPLLELAQLLFDAAQDVEGADRKLRDAVDTLRDFRRQLDHLDGDHSSLDTQAQMIETELAATRDLLDLARP